MLAFAQETGRRRAYSGLHDSPYQAADSSKFNLPENFFRKASCPCGGGCPACQAKSSNLAISQPNDPAEIEADQIADRVMRMAFDEVTPKSNLAHKPNAIHRKCDACGEEELDESPVMREEAFASAAPNPPPSDMSPLIRDVINSGGQPLDAATRAFFEPRFGVDFRNVRVHSDSEANESARVLAARAYASGEHIVFAAGEYMPGSPSGYTLIAHELAHTLQQSKDTSVVARQEMDAGVPRDAGESLPGGVPYHPDLESIPTEESTHEPSPRERLAECGTPYRPAVSFQTFIDLVRAAEVRLSAVGITSVTDQIHILRGIYYGTVWSLDYAVERSQLRNEGFQRFTRPSMSPATSVPRDPRSILDCGLFTALQQSQDLVDPSSRHVDVGHLIIGLDARSDPSFRSPVQYPVMGGLSSIDLGGTGTELVTWLGDLGGGAGSLATRRVAAPTTSSGTVFRGSDYGGSINLEGDIAAFVVASGTASTLTAPVIPSGTRLSNALQSYLSPSGASPAWTTRAESFLRMYGATIDASGSLTNRSTLISVFASKIQTFACNYMASRVRDGHISYATARIAAAHVPPASLEVATAFIDALDNSRRTGSRIEATSYPAVRPSSPGACGPQIAAGGLAGSVGL